MSVLDNNKTLFSLPITVLAYLIADHSKVISPESFW